METVRSSETSVNFYHITRRHIPEKSNLLNQCFIIHIQPLDNYHLARKMHTSRIATSVLDLMQKSGHLYAGSIFTPKPRISHLETSELEAWCVKECEFNSE
jgi:hypothetical protein